MARRTDHNGKTVAIAAGVVQTLTWTSSDLPGERTVAYHVGFSGAGNDLGDVTRIRASANGANIINCTPEQLRAYLESYSKGTIILGAAETRFTIPFCMLDAPMPDMQDTSQFPRASQVQLELTLAATAVAGSATVAYTESDMEPTTFPRLLASSMNIPASTQNQRFNFQENGVVRGFAIPQTGVDRCRLVLGGEVVTWLPGAQYLGVTFGSLLAEAERIYGSGQTLTTTIFSQISVGRPAPSNSSFIELTTGAAWAGVANEITLYALAPNGDQLQG